ncbi:MAG: CPBP family intramembrane metalloprotease [Actinobacteria bacterium]|nr:CPBP family intramembrane metalloprotease [Actinomycetota bacterium]
MAAEWGQDVPWRPRDIWLSLLVGLGLSAGLIGVFFIGWSLADVRASDTILFSVLTVLVYAGFFAGVYLIVVRRRGVSFSDIGFVRVRATTLALMLPITVGLQLVLGIIVFASSPLLGEPPSASEQLVLGGSPALSVGEVVLLLVDAALIAPFVEELIFRGLVYRYLRGRWNVIGAVIVSSALFAATHLIVPLMPVLFALGIVLARITERYRSLYPAVAVHGLNNGLAVLLVAFTT